MVLGELGENRIRPISAILANFGFAKFPYYSENLLRAAVTSRVVQARKRLKPPKNDIFWSQNVIFQRF